MQARIVLHVYKLANVAKRGAGHTSAPGERGDPLLKHDLWACFVFDFSQFSVASVPTCAWQALAELARLPIFEWDRRSWRLLRGVALVPR